MGFGFMGLGFRAKGLGFRVQVWGSRRDSRLSSVCVSPAARPGTATRPVADRQGSFRKLRVPDFGVLIRRILLFRVLY